MAQQKTMATCPECGAKVRKDNLRGHIAKIHTKTGEQPKKEVAKPARPSTKRMRKVSPWPAIALAMILGLGTVGAYAYWTWYSGATGGGSAPPAKNPVAVISTSMGTFKIELQVDKAPVTAGNFISLAEAGFYNSLTFHQIMHGFVIQGGDPNGDGSGGSGQSVPWENTGLKNVRYSVAMARSGDANLAQDKDTASSQFFVNLKDNPSLDSYTYPFVVFGRVIDGHSVVNAIGSVQTGADDRPLTPVTMYAVTIVR